MHLSEGHFRALQYLEKEDIIQGYIHKVLDPFMETIVNVNDIEVFKMLISFYNISEIYFHGDEKNC